MPVRSTVRRAMASGLKAGAAAADRIRPPEPGVAFLIYHRVGRRTTATVDLATELFDAQVGELAAAGRVLAIDAAVELLVGGGPVPTPTPVVLTFDDGTDDWNEVVLPVLERHRAPATFYVATATIEGGASLPGGGRPASWNGLAELRDSGLATIGSHTHSHALLDRADGATAAEELDRSIDLLGDRLGVATAHFAYPKALAGSPAAAEEVRRRFATAALAGGRANRPGRTDLHGLARTPVQVADGMHWFRRKADGGLGLEDWARTLVNRRRYASATS